MNYPYILSFRKTVSLKDEGADGMALISPTGKLCLKNLSSGMHAVLIMLLNIGGTEDRLSRVMESDAFFIQSLF